MIDVKEPLIPKIGVVTDIRIDTPDVKTFRVVTPDGKKAFEHKPGQCAMLSVPGVGEAMFSITSSPTNEEYMEFSIKKCGCVTEWLHSMEVGQQITIRGPYGRPFPVDTEFVGKDMLFIAGGIGLAPLRSVINYCRHYRDRYGKIDIVYGSRSMQDLVDYKEIIDEWANDAGVTDFRGLGLLRGVLVCHFSPERAALLERLRRESPWPVYALGDGDSLVADAEQIRLYGKSAQA